MSLAEGLLKFQLVPVNCPNWDLLGQVSDSKGLVKLHVLCIITLGSEYQIHHDVYVHHVNQIQRLRLTFILRPCLPVVRS